MFKLRGLQHSVRTAFRVYTDKKFVNHSTYFSDDPQKKKYSNNYSAKNNSDLGDKEDLTFVSLGMDDLDDVMPLLKDHFVPYEPIHLGLGASYEDTKDWLKTITIPSLVSPYSVGARNSLGELVAIFNGKNQIKGIADLKDEYAYSKEDEIVKCFQKILFHAGGGGHYDIFREYDVNEVLFLTRITIHSNYRGQGLYSKLFDMVEQKAADKGIKIAYSIATGTAGQMLSQKQGYVAVNETQYKIFSFLNCKKMGGNTSIQLMVKKLN